MDQMYEYLLEFGSMGMFAAFLVWQHLNMQKRFDTLVEKFQEQLEKIRGDHKDDVQTLRDRYDSVLEGYNSERTQVRVNVAERIADLSKTIGDIPIDAIQIQIEAVALNQRNSHLILEKGMGMMREMQEDAKLKAMAKKLSDKDA